MPIEIASPPDHRAAIGWFTPIWVIVMSLQLRFEDRRLGRQSRRKHLSRAARPLLFEPLEARRLLIFYDSFENGLLSSWSIPNLGTEGRVEIRDLYAEGVITNSVSRQFGQNGNGHALAFDSTRACR